MVDRTLKSRTEYAVRTFAKRLVELKHNLRRHWLGGFGRLVNRVGKSNLSSRGPATPRPRVTIGFVKIYDI